MQKECLGKYKGETSREYEGNDKKKICYGYKKKQPPFGWLQNEDSYMYVLKVVTPLLLVLLLVRVHQ